MNAAWLVSFDSFAKLFRRGPVAVVAAAALSLAPLSGAALGQINPVPPPIDVSGKVISDWILTGDQQSDGTANPHMTREWDGLGDTTDSLDYTGSLAAVLGPLAAPDVDALANIQDLFFHEVVNDYATLLVSPKVLQNDPLGGLNEIYFRTSTPFGSLAAPWAKNAPDIGGAPPPGDNIPPEGIDGLELWGGGRDHNIFSLYNDPPDVTGRKISLFIYDAANDASAPYIYNDEIRTAIGLAPGTLDVDVDGLMVFDDAADGIFGAGDSILFSVSENQSAGGPFHGGEIWVWDFGNPAGFLMHGGILWDSLNQPALLFGWTGAAGDPINDINALEAIFVVPEPASIVLVICGFAAVLARRRLG
jgi:hypothetical protein